MEKISSTPENAHFPLEKSVRDRQPICGKIDTQKLHNVPLHEEEGRGSASMKLSFESCRSSCSGGVTVPDFTRLEMIGGSWGGGEIGSGSVGGSFLLDQWYLGVI